MTNSVWSNSFLFLHIQGGCNFIYTFNEMGNYFLVYIIIQQHFYTAAAIRYNKQVPVTAIIHTLLFSTHHFVIWLMVKMVVCYCCFEY